MIYFLDQNPSLDRSYLDRLESAGLKHVTHFAKPTGTESEKFGETMASDEQRQLGVAVGVERCRSGASDGPIAGARGSTDGIPFQPLNFSKRSPRKVPWKSRPRK